MLYQIKPVPAASSPPASEVALFDHESSSCRGIPYAEGVSHHSPEESADRGIALRLPNYGIMERAYAGGIRGPYAGTGAQHVATVCATINCIAS